MPNHWVLGRAQFKAWGIKKNSVLRPEEELRELESLSMAINIMFCIREKVLLPDINQQNDKPTQKTSFQK